MSAVSIVYAVLLAGVLLALAGVTVYTTVRLLRQGSSYKHHNRKR